MRSTAVRSVADFFTDLAQRLRARRSASVDGLAGDEGVDLRLRVNAASPAADKQQAVTGWMPEVTEFLEARSVQPPAHADTCARWFADSDQRGLFVFLGAGGAGKSWSTAQDIARQAELLAAGLNAGNLLVDGDWVAPFWVHAPTLMDFLPRHVELLAAGHQPAGDAATRFLCFLHWFRAGDIEITSSIQPESQDALWTILARKILAGCYTVVFDAVNELAAKPGERGCEAFHDVVKALADRVSDGRNPHPGRLVFCCRPEAWEEIALRKLLLPEGCVRATRCDLLPLESEQINEMARRHHARSRGATAGADPGTGQQRWERLSGNGEPHEGGLSPLMLALILGAGLTLDTARSLDVAAIFDKVCDAFLRGSWHERGSHLANAEGLGITPTPNLDDRFATAKEIVCLTSCFLFQQNPGGNAFHSDHWIEAFGDAMDSLSHAGRRAMFETRVTDPDAQALAWLRACNDQGLLARDGEGFRFLRHLLFSYLAAYGLAMFRAEDRASPDPWFTAFLELGMDHGRIDPACSSLFGFLPGAAMHLLRDGEAGQRVRDEAETARRLTGLCRLMRESVLLDFAGFTTVLGLAIVGQCDGVDRQEKKVVIADAMRRFPLDGGVALRLRSDGRLADFAEDEVAAGVEAQIRDQLRTIGGSSRPFWVREIMRESGMGPIWTRWRHDRTVKSIFSAIHWLLAVGAPEQAKEVVLRTVRVWSLRMTPQLRVVTLQMIHTLSRTAPAIFSSEALRSVAREMYDDALAVLSLPHAVNALPGSRSDMLQLQAFALENGLDPVQSSRNPARPLWQAGELHAVWNQAPAPVDPASLPPRRRRLANLSIALVRSIAREECDFWLWFRAAYLHRAQPGSDRHRIAAEARYLIRRRLPKRYFYHMAFAVVCTLLLRMPDAAEKRISLPRTSAIGRDFAYLPPPSSWPNALKLILRGLGFYWFLVWIGAIYLFVLLLRYFHEPESYGQTHWISAP